MDKMEPANSKGMVPAVAAANSSVAENTGKFNSRDVSTCCIDQLPLPYDIILQIFSYLPCTDLWTASRSCREFKFVIQQLSPMKKHCALGDPLITKPLGHIETMLLFYENESTKLFNDLNAWHDRFIKRHKMSEEEAAFRTQTPLTIAASIVSKAGLTDSHFPTSMLQESITAENIDSYQQIIINLYLTKNFVFKIEGQQAFKDEVNLQGKTVKTAYRPSEKEIMDSPTLKMQVQQKKRIMHDLMIEEKEVYFNDLIKLSLENLHLTETIPITKENTICLPHCGILMLNQDLQKLYYINSETSSELKVSAIDLMADAKIKAIHKTENGTIALFSECSIIIASWCSENCGLIFEATYPLPCNSDVIKKILPLGKNFFLAMTNVDISTIKSINDSWFLWQRNHELGTFMRVSVQSLSLQNALNCTLIDQDHIMVCKRQEILIIPKEALVSGNEEEIQHKKIPLKENEIIYGISSSHDLITAHLMVNNTPSNDDGEFEYSRSHAAVSQTILKLFKICKSYSQTCPVVFEMGPEPMHDNKFSCKTTIKFCDKPWIVMGFSGGLLQIIAENKQGHYSIIATNDTKNEAVLKLAILSSDTIVSFHENNKIRLWSIEQQEAKVSLVSRGSLQHCRINPHDNNKLYFS